MPLNTDAAIYATGGHNALLAVKRRANRPAFQSWRVPAVRHELILYAEVGLLPSAYCDSLFQLFAAVLVLFALRDFALTPWAYVDQLHRQHRLHHAVCAHFLAPCPIEAGSYKYMVHSERPL
jgi:hypothetical protein